MHKSISAQLNKAQQQPQCQKSIANPEHHNGQSKNDGNNRTKARSQPKPNPFQSHPTISVAETEKQKQFVSK